MSDELHIDALRRAYAARTNTRPAEDCPSPEDVLAAAHGALPRARTLEVVDHVGHCADCAEAWRLALAFVPADTVDARPVDRAPVRSELWRWGAIAATVLVVAGIGVRVVPGLGDGGYTGDDGVPVYREVPQGEAIARVGAASLARDAFVLRWSPLPGPTRYTVRVFGPALEPLHVVEDIDVAEATVPAAALAGLPDGADVSWRVEARTSDGATVASPAFTTRIASATDAR